MTTLLQKKSLTGILALTSMLASLALTGCDKLPNNNDTETETAKVEIPKTAPLVAGESVSAALSRALPTQENNTHNNEQANTQTSTNNQQANQPIATPSATPRSSSSTQNNKEQSIVTNQTQTGTPEFILKQALNTIYFGDAKQASKYFQQNTPRVQQMLKETQPVFRQDIESITFVKTTYNKDKTQANIESSIKLNGVAEPQTYPYEMLKINEQWKIVNK